VINFIEIYNSWKSK